MGARQGQKSNGVNEAARPSRSGHGDGARRHRKAQEQVTLAFVWSDEATTDLLDILDYIAARNPAASERLNAAIQHTADRLPEHPYLHRPGRVPGTREAIVHPNYIIIYRVIEVVEVLAVVHARRQYP